MINICLSGDDHVSGEIVTLPQVPRRGDHFQLYHIMFRVTDVIWTPADLATTATLVLEFDYNVS